MNVEQGIIVAQGFAAFGTLTLAYFAFKAIRQTRETQRELRKEGHLREVANWAVDVMSTTGRWELPQYPPELIGFEESSIEQWGVKQTALLIGSISRHLELVFASGEYIEMIAEGIDKELRSKVADTRDSVISLRDDMIDGGFSEIKKELRDPMLENAKQIMRRVSTLMGSP